ncbi:hypothetical protein ACHHYP_02252 [Achlya hypogyna]|uniref:Ataxin-10 domain-containing protein n=1 Tax=Achlya hypogyna TaxID=1202772 RepID=A0A1V9Z750_ACHHY|nr:hypothetical protein ACHHYP_02252 [Achlya hypogyna]
MVKHSLQEQLTAFRKSASEDQLVDAAGLMSVLLVKPDERAAFAHLDGPTTLGKLSIRLSCSVPNCLAVNHLQQLCAEQAAMAMPWTYSKAFGFHIGQKRLHTCLRYLLICITHMTLDAAIAEELSGAQLPQMLFDEFVAQKSTTTPSIARADDGASLPLPQSCRLLALEALRNLSYTEAKATPHFSTDALDDLWDLLLTSTLVDEVGLVADVLCNLSTHAPRSLHATKDRLDALVKRLVDENQTDDPRVRIGLGDVAVNLARDNHYSVVFLCALEAGPAPGRPIHFLRDWAEDCTDAGLRATLEALTHNLAWSDVSTKIALQKLGASSFLQVFVG